MRIRLQDAEAPARGWLREADAGQAVALPDAEAAADIPDGR
jgi:hypothetical protein